MNREILFRGKCVDNGEWVYGYYLRLNNKSYISQNPKNGQGIEITRWAEVIPETVGQYTGLTDKNGKKIFEGDIVNCMYYGSAIKGVIKFGEYKTPYEKGHIGFYIDWDLTKQLANFFKENISRIEVTGNIHDNPELLEAAE